MYSCTIHGSGGSGDRTTGEEEDGEEAVTCGLRGSCGDPKKCASVTRVVIVIFLPQQPPFGLQIKYRSDFSETC